MGGSEFDPRWSEQLIMGKDILRDRFQSIKKIATESGLGFFVTQFLDSLDGDEIEVFPGRMKRREQMVVGWDMGMGAIEEFLAAAKAAGAPLIYAQQIRFSFQEDLPDTIAGIPGIDDSEKERRVREAGQFRLHDGSISRIIFAFRINDVWHLYDDAAEWAAEYLELLAIEEECDVLDAEDEGSGLSEGDVERYAGEIARDPDFPEMKKDAIQYKLKRKYPQVFGEIVTCLEEIISQAKGMYATEIRPEMDRKVADRAKKLLAEGNSHRKAAEALGLTPKRLSEILERVNR